jgi:hypothetical protein
MEQEFQNTYREEKRGLWEGLTKGEKFITILLLFVFLFVFYVTLDANKYRATVLVIEGEGRVGVNPTTEALDFGDLSPGTSGIRRVEVANNTPIPMYIVSVELGSISDLMSVDKNFYTLPARTTERFEYSVYMPASAPVGDRLDGKVWLFKIPIFFGG